MNMNNPSISEPQDVEKMRFQSELEFVQCLANPHYLNFLAQRDYFKDSRFVNYLKYLQYWKEPQYAKFLKFPQCLHFLELLQYESFRKELANAQCVKFIEDQQLLHWQHYSYKRMRLQQEAIQQQHQAVQAAMQQHPPTQQAGHPQGQPPAPQPHHPGSQMPPISAMVSQSRLLTPEQKPLQALAQNHLNMK